VSDELLDHYAQLADTYDDTWSHRPDYVTWMTDHMLRHLCLRPGEWIGDIGVGTGLFVRGLLPYATERTPLVCVDPSTAMLRRLPRDPRLRPIPATAEDLAAGRVELPHAAFDALVIKEAVHHFTDLTETLTRLAGRLTPGGRLLIVTLPPKLDYPLFPAALDRFAAGQPELETIAATLRRTGLAVTTQMADFPVSIERERWSALVANRWMSVLSTFSDTELSRGLNEIAEQHPAQHLEFTDRFAFILGHRPE
jgi:SAM-dependent methyltransferase